jgi:hypothetical protein
MPFGHQTLPSINSWSYRIRTKLFINFNKETILGQQIVPEFIEYDLKQVFDRVSACAEYNELIYGDRGGGHLVMISWISGELDAHISSI